MTIPVERVSKYIRADAILEIAQDMGLERTRVVAVNDWDESRKFMLTAQHQGKTFTTAIDPSMKPDEVRERLQAEVFYRGDQWTEPQVREIKRRKRRTA